MAMHRLGIISDTHGLLRPEVKAVLAGCSHILHGGDIADRKTYDAISAIAPCTFVRGNMDREWADFLPAEQDIVLHGFRFYMVHNIDHRRKELGDVDFVVFGHSHQYEDVVSGNVRYLNPGSCGPKRFWRPVTMMVLNVDDVTREATAERIDCLAARPQEKQPPAKDMDRLVQDILKDMRANRDVAEIARRNHAEVELVRQILQIYTNHPGIGVDGILDRMEGL